MENSELPWLVMGNVFYFASAILFAFALATPGVRNNFKTPEEPFWKTFGQKVQKARRWGF